MSGARVSAAVRRSAFCSVILHDIIGSKLKRVHVSSAIRRAFLTAAAALTMLLLTGAADVVGPRRDSFPTTLIGATLATEGTPSSRAFVPGRKSATNAVTRLEPEIPKAPQRGPSMAALDDETVEAFAAGAMSEEDAVLALERELSLKVGKQTRDEDYPEEAQRWRWTGTVMIDVVVGANGSIKDVSLGKTSGFRVLDAQALTVVRRVSKLYVPALLRGRDVAVTIPIGFYLQGM
jgi:TonB family protein